jgi:hypothetical protein
MSPTLSAERKVRVPETKGGFVIEKRDRFWAVIDPAGELVCIAVYRRGAREVVRRLIG